jgi:hypothetical protein
MLEDEVGEVKEVQFHVGTPSDSRGVILSDPSDHTVLETIYNKMHSEQFINLSPLSLLANMVGL